MILDTDDLFYQLHDSGLLILLSNSEVLGLNLEYLFCMIDYLDVVLYDYLDISATTSNCSNTFF